MRQTLWIIFSVFFSLNLFGQIKADSKVNTFPDQNLFESREKVMIDHAAILKSAKSHDSRSPFIISLPIYGVSEIFEVIPNDVWDAESRRLYPDLLTFDLVSTNNSRVYGALTLSSSGLYATVYNMGKMVSIYPDSPNQAVNHIVEYGIQPEISKMKNYCGHDHSHEEMIKKPSKLNGGLRSMVTMGTKKHTYDVAIVTTGEFYINNGNTDNAVRAVVVNSVNAIGAIFNVELSFRLTINSNRIFYYKDPATDIFIPDEAGGNNRPDQAATAVGMNFTANSYDIGHVFHQHADGDGWGNGGIAQLRSVCNNNGTPISKARGWSGAYSNVGNGWISLATHEFGHQFGANHTFNGIGGSCTDAINENNSYEIGSGTTIMSYNGICDANQNIPNGDVLDNYFHIKSLEEMYEFVYNGSGGPCGNPTTSTNKAPVIVNSLCGSTITIPKNTPFFLNQTVLQDTSEKETITACWEQIDEDGPGKPTVGKIGTIAGSDARAPLFRSYPPSRETSRYFPALNILASGSPSAFEPLPTVARTMNFNLSVRDNNSNGGTIANDDVVVTVANSGPFIITSPVGGETIIAGNTTNVTWNTNGSNSLCSNIRIRVSVDGGMSYPTVLAENIPYSAGTFSLPINRNFVNTTKARFMLECMDNDCFTFFNVSKNDFTISSTCRPENVAICPTSSITFDEGDPALNLTMTKYTGTRAPEITRIVNGTSPFGSAGVRGLNGSGCGVEENIRTSRVNIYVTETGSYTFNFSGEGWVSLHRSNFNPNSPCNSFVASTGTRASSGGLFTGSGFTVNLTQCTEYTLIFFTYSMFYPATLSVSVESGPGLVLESITNPSPSYKSIYALVNSTSGLIAYAGSSSDFRATNSGKYTLYSLVVESTLDPATLIGQAYVTIKNSICLNESYNSRSIEIKPSCRISDVISGVQSPCVASTNSFTQQLIVTYDKAPTTGKLSVNGQEFDITGSPQTILLTGLDSDGSLNDVTVVFTASTDCRFTKTGVFTSPVNCCPLTFDLGADINKCVGETVLLNGGDNGVTYIWKKDGIVQSGTTSKTFPVSSSGVYEVEVTHSTGCKKTDRITVTFNPLPVVLLADNQKFCIGETYDLIATVSGAQTLEWFKDNTLISGQVTNTIQINSSGLYRLVATSSFNCKGLDETIVTTIAAPVVNLGADLKKCDGEKAILDAGPDGTVYQWFKDGLVINSATKSTFEAVQTGLYRVVVINATQCRSEDVVKVDFFSSPTINDFPTLINICQGSSNTISAVGANFNALQWFYDNNPITGAITLSTSADKSGLYTIEATNNAGCKTRKSVQVEIRALPAVDLGSATLVSCIGNPVNLNAGPDGTKYVWSKDGIILPQTSQLLSINQDGSYKVTVTNQFNCINTDEINVSFIPGPSVSLNGNATICEGSNHIIQLTTNAVNPEIKWFNDQGQIAGETGPSLLVTVAGNYRVSVKGGTPACEVTQSVLITVNPRPALNLGNDKTLCDGDTPPVLSGGVGNVSYNWTLNGAALATTQNVTASQSGLYVVTTKNSFNCERTEQVRITFEAKPTLEMVNDSYDLCEGTELTINAVSNGTKFEWMKSNVIIAGQTGKLIKINSSGNYSLTVSNQANCKIQKSFTVISRINPIVDIGADFALCPGENKTLNAGTQTKYVWSDNSTSQSLLINSGQPAAITTNKYSVTVTNQFGCTNRDSVVATFYPVVKAVIIADKPGICNGEPVKLTASGGLRYKWTDPSGNSLSTLNEAVTTASPVATTIYTVEVSDGVCPTNIDTETIEIKVFEPVNISAGPDTCIVIGRLYKMNASGGTSYQWDNTNLIEGPSNIPNPSIKPTIATVFTVTITDINGCKFTDEVNICVKEDNFKPVTLITPNGDGKNDELFFGNLADYPDNTLRVFNRWGNVIFEAENYQNTGNLFNGFRNGERLPADTYYYILTFDNQVIKSALTILWD